MASCARTGLAVVPQAGAGPPLPAVQAGVQSGSGWRESEALPGLEHAGFLRVSLSHSSV